MRYPIHYAMVTIGSASNLSKVLIPTDADLAQIRHDNAKITERIQKALEKDALKWAATLDKKYPKQFTKNSLI